MKIKNDFVTNSSSTSFILKVYALFNLEDDPDMEIKEFQFELDPNTDEFDGEQPFTIDSIKELETRLKKYDFKGTSSRILPLEFKQEVEYHGDGWDGGDFYFAGIAGQYFRGSSMACEEFMTKRKTIGFNKITGKLEYPAEWDTEEEYLSVQLNRLERRIESNYDD